MKMVDKVRTKAHVTDAVTELEKRNRAVALKAAEEAIVLLKNNGVLPLAAGAKVALYGDGATNTVKCGSGSGECNNRESISILEGMEAAGFQIVSKDLLMRYKVAADQDRADYVKRQIDQAGFLNFKVTMSAMAAPYSNPEFTVLKEEMLNRDADTCIYVISRISGEGYDRKLEKGDYYLSDTEKRNILLCAKNYAHMILIINAGGPVDYSAADAVDFDAILYMSMLGETGGEAVANVLSGKVCPSGHLTDSWAKKYEDIPFSDEFSFLNGNTEKEYYKENIFVGYRYFDTFRVQPKFSFGYGLSYTSFDMEGEISLSRRVLTVLVRVKNVGPAAGKAVAQVYVSCPDGLLRKEYQRLVGFAKTKLLSPEEEEVLAIRFSVNNLVSYHEETASYLLEKGNYVIRLGQSSEDTCPISILTVNKTAVMSKHDRICPLQDSLDILEKPYEQTDPEGTLLGEDAMKENPELRRIVFDAEKVETKVYSYDEPYAELNGPMDPWISKLTDEELCDFLAGCGNDMLIPMKHYYTTPGATGYSTNRYFHKGIPDISFCDGPAGLRFQQKSVAVKGKNITKAITPSIDLLNYVPKLIKLLGFGKESDGTVLYQYATAFPVGTALAQTWNQELTEEVGRAANAELEEYHITFWLAPGMNIHKNPLCGRNYEYYSEDPLLTGKIAAAMTRGVQAKGNHSVALKHFFCNNQETNRQGVSAVVSERAIREIYLTGFEIAVKEGHAKGVMTSYNKVNGTYSAVNRDAVTKVLRREWGFDGLVMTDWDSMREGLEADRAVYAGTDIQMAGEKKQVRQIRKAMIRGKLDKTLVRISAARVLRMICMCDEDIDIKHPKEKSE